MPLKLEPLEEEVTTKQCVEVSRKTRKVTKPNNAPFKIVDKIYYCVLSSCGNSEPNPRLGFKNKERYFKHVLANHSSPNECKFSCNYCEESFAMKELLDRHIRFKHEMKFCCTTCGKGFAMKSRLLRHEQCHKWSKQHPCDLCSYRANTKEALQCHRKRHDPGERKHICGFCGKGFFTPGTLKEHELTHSDIKRFTCDICGRQLRNDSCVRKHMVNVHGVKHTCDLCGKNYSSPLGLQLHQRESHGISF